MDTGLGRLRGISSKVNYEVFRDHSKPGLLLKAQTRAKLAEMLKSLL